MVKYIVKRILLAFLILFGVSLIIYTLVRLMPTDFVDQQLKRKIYSGSKQFTD